jgi:hypothetical protein
VQALLDVELAIEQRIEQVEARDPDRDCRTERPRLPRQAAGDRNPGTDRREPVDEPEPDMAQPREALQVRIDDEPDERDRPQPAHDRIELEARHEVERNRESAEGDDLHARKPSGRQLAVGRARIASVYLRIDHAVQPHRQRTRTEHRKRDPDEIVRRRNPVDAEQRADVGKRQSEDGVLDLHERGEPARKRDRGRHVG